MKLLVRWLTNIAMTTVAVWVATSLVPDYRVGGTFADRCLILLLTGAVTFLGIWSLARPVERWAERFAQGRLKAYMKRGSMKDFALFSGALLLSALINVVTITTVAPVSIGLATMLAGALGLPVHLGGLWPTVVAGVLVYAVRPLLVEVALLVIDFRRRRTRLLRVGGLITSDLVALGGISVALGVLGGVGLEPAPWPRQLLTLFVLTRVFNLFSLDFQAPFLTLLSRTAGNAIKLWCLASLSDWMDVSLRIDGFWDLVLAAFIVTIANFLYRVVDAFVLVAHRRMRR